MEISIGKFTLESLTTGMYSEPESCYREYIQNAVDSLDLAVSQGIISQDDCRIEIIVDNSKSSISIKDNGTGISNSLAAKTLLDIGNSTKLHTTNRGFRGIGRLGGLSYCKKLSFCTTFKGEDVKTIISFDCEKLKKLLVPGQHSDKDLRAVINDVTEVSVLPEQQSAHYFIVKMDDVDDIASLLDLDIVRDYISQVAPIPFKSRFFWGRQIKNELEEKGIQIAEYPIFLGSSFEDLTQVFKPYKLTLNVSARSDVTKDEIYGLSFFDILSDDGSLIAAGWYADTGFLGTLADDEISGIRVRQGNILIGTSKTLSPFFKESRFNAWSLGEIYVVSEHLIPNARRDDFEKNDVFSRFEAGVRNTVGTEVTDKIRAASKARNNPAQKTISKAEKTVSRVQDILTSGFNSSFEKEQVAAEVIAAKQNLSAIPKSSKPEIIEQKNQLLEKLSTLTTEVAESSNYKAKSDITSSFSKAEKKIIQAILEVLSKNFERPIVDSLYKEMLDELKKREKIMQLYPEKYDKLALSSEEKSFIRTIDRAFSGDELSYYVLHINPRRKDIGNGQPELFNLFVWSNGIILFRFFETNENTIAEMTIKAISQPIVYQMLFSDIQGRLEESQYLVNSIGELKYALNICFIFPNIESATSLPHLAKEERDFAEKHILFKDAITRIRKMGAAAFSDWIKPLHIIEEDRINNIFQRLCPEITIPRKYVLTGADNTQISDAALQASDRAVLSYRLDKRQIDIVNRIDKGHQLILACAGSGKSVLLISKCFKVASLNPNDNFLITCYNRNLNNYYQWAIAQAGFTNRNVRCTTFYGLCRQLLDSNRLPLPVRYQGKDNEYYDRLFATADKALQEGKIKERFSGIFIDEVQIFKPEWYRFCFNLLRSKNADEYFFVIAGDKSQDIKNNIRRGKAPWQGGGDQFPEYRGKTLPIETNYRNSKPINDAIDRYVIEAKALGAQLGVDLTSDPELFLRGTAYREGNPPTLVELKDYSNEGEATAICDAVKDLIENKGLSEVDIAIVLYNRAGAYTPPGWATHYYSLLPGIKSYFYKQGWEYPAILISGESEGATYGSRRGVTIATIEGSLGLDFRAIVLAGLRPLGIHEKARKASDFIGLSGEVLAEKQEAFKKNVNFIYTGCTRAKDELTVILSDKQGESLYLDLLRKAF